MTNDSGAASSGSQSPVVQNSDVTQAAPSGVPVTSFDLSSADMAAIRSTPAAVGGYFDALSETSGGAALTGAAAVAYKLGTAFAGLSAEGAYATYAAAVSFNVAPSNTYATSVPPLTATLSELLSSQYLACGGYCKLAIMLATQRYGALPPPDAPSGAAAKATAHMLVWLESAPINIGVHSQIVIANVLPNAYLLLDPYYAYAMRLPFGAQPPDPTQEVIVNAATLLQQPAQSGNVVQLDPAPVPERNQVMTAMMSGTMGPTYVYHDALYGSEGWDTVLATLAQN